MKKTLYLIICCIWISFIICGCETTKTYHKGNYLTDPESQINDLLASDAGDMITKLYSPAFIELVFTGDNDNNKLDRFGLTLQTFLRSKGYAIREVSVSPDAKVEGYLIDYTIDYLDENQISLILYVGQQKLSRAYSVNSSQDAITPFGEWSRME